MCGILSQCYHDGTIVLQGVAQIELPATMDQIALAAYFITITITTIIIIIIITTTITIIMSKVMTGLLTGIQKGGNIANYTV